MNKEHKDPDEINLNAPRLAWLKQKLWYKHQHTVYLVDIKLAQERGFQVLSNTIKRNHPSRHDSSLLYPEGCHDGIWRSHIRERYMRHLYFLQRFPLKTIG